MRLPLPTHKLVSLSLVAMGLAVVASVALATPGLLDSVGNRLSAAAQGSDDAGPAQSTATGPAQAAEPNVHYVVGPDGRLYEFVDNDAGGGD